MTNVRLLLAFTIIIIIIIMIIIIVILLLLIPFQLFPSKYRHSALSALYIIFCCLGAQRFSRRKLQGFLFLLDTYFYPLK